MGAAMSFFFVCLLFLFAEFSCVILSCVTLSCCTIFLRKYLAYNLKIHSYHCSRQVFIQGHGPGNLSIAEDVSNHNRNYTHDFKMAELFRDDERSNAINRTIVLCGKENQSSFFLVTIIHKNTYTNDNIRFRPE